jgi:iron complex outermembrane receptor protein
LANPSSSEDWEWTVGLYYFKDDVDRVEIWDTTGFGSSAGIFDAVNETTSKAVFGQVSYNLDDWRFTLGGRYTAETKDFSLTTSGSEAAFGFLPAAYPTATADKSWGNFSSKFSVDYMGIENVLIYLSMSEGFKSGSFNSLSPTAAEAVQSLDPELATQVELGLKSQWFDDRLRINAVLFDIDYEDLQVFQTVGLTVVVDNAGQATSKGAEFEIIALPIEGLELSATYSYLDATYDEYVLGSDDFSGNDLTRSPQNTYTLSSSYSFGVGDAGDMNLRLDYVNQSKLYINSSNVDGSKIDGFGLLNARVGFESANGEWELALWGKNLSDKEYEVHRGDLSAFGTATNTDIQGAPRTYGVSFTYNL